MEWTDNGIVLAARPYGESAAVTVILTQNYGRHAGLVRGATSQRIRGIIQPGNRVEVTWRARMREHLGTYNIELLESCASDLFDDPLRLAGIASSSAVANRSLPEREPHLGVYRGLLVLINAIKSQDDGEAWVAAYVGWELGLLADLGFGLDLSKCAATGTLDNLTYVSPKTGRAISSSVGKDYHEKLLRLPNFLTDKVGGDRIDLIDGLALTGYFLNRHVFGSYNEQSPPARERFVQRLKVSKY